MFPYPRILIALGVACCARPVDPNILAADSDEIRPALAERLQLAPEDHRLLDKIRSRFDGAVPNRVHVQTDKPLYRPGDTIWVASTDLDGRTLRGHDYRSGPQPGISYTLIDPSGAEFQKVLAKEKRGRGSASFDLPDSARGGPWTLKATAIDGTSAEREIVVLAFEPPQIKKDLEFERDAYGPGDEVRATIEVRRATGEPLADTSLRVMLRIGGEDIEAPDVQTDSQGLGQVMFDLPEDLSTIDGLLTVLASDGGISESISRNIPIVLAGVEVAFFPEGGELVTGLRSRVYVEATDRFGRPADIEGQIVDDEGKRIANLRTVRDGLGRVPFTPETGRSYELVVTKPEGQTKGLPLPPAARKGCVMRTIDDVDGESLALSVQVQCTEEQEIVLLASQQGQLIDAARVPVNERGSTLRLLAEDEALQTAQGIARVTLLSGEGEPMAERLVYRNRARDLQISLEPTGKRYGPRDEVEVEITTRDADGLPVPAMLSMAVVDDTVLSWADDEQGDLRTAIHLESRIGGRIDEPAKYFDRDEPESAAALELLVGARGWRRFVKVPTRVAHSAPDDAMAATNGEQAVVEEAKNPNVAGGASNENTYLLDGANITDPVTGTFSVNFKMAGAVQAESMVVSQALTKDFLRRIPAGRSYQSAVQLAPHVIHWNGNPNMANGAMLGLIHGNGNASESNYQPNPRLSSKQWRTLEACWDEQTLRSPELAGTANIQASLDQLRQIKVANVHTNPHNGAIIDCIQDRASHMRVWNAGDIRHVQLNMQYGEGNAGPSLAWTTERVFPKPNHAPDDTVRSDFRDTIWWDASIETDKRGQAVVRFPLSDAVTSFRLTAEGHAAGQVGHAEKVITSKLPFSLFVKIPAAAADTDEPRLPVVVTNERNVAIEVELEGMLGDLAKVDGELKRTLILPAHARSTEFFDLSFVGTRGTVPVAFKAAAGGLTDEIRREIEVTPAGFAVQLSSGGTLDEPATLDFDLSSAIPGTVLADVKVYPSQLSGLTEGMAGMLRQPGGCFEQTSSSNYPNVMISQFMERNRTMNPDLARRTKGYLETGYARLTGYETKTKGFEWFGKAPGHEGLTAYGLIQFTDMKGVYPGVDDKMMDRTATWLLSRTDGKGGFLRNERALHRFSQPSDEVMNAYITWAMVESGYGEALNRELDRAAAESKTTDDAYLLALYANTLLKAPGRRSDGLAASRRLVSMQESDGSWQRAKYSIMMSGGRNLHIETTALATLALIESGTAPGRLSLGMNWLISNRDGQGRFGQTQATIMALRTLMAHSGGQDAEPDGAVAIQVNGRNVGALTYANHAVNPPSFGLPLIAGKNRIEFGGDDSTLPWSAGVTFATWTPPDSGGAIHIDTAFSRREVPMGETIRMVGTVHNRGPGAPMTTVHLGYPGGLSFSPKQLDDLVERRVIDAWETLPREIIVHFRDMAPDERVEIPVDLTADVPGSWTSPPSQAYLYYTDELRTWAPPREIRVAPASN